MKSATRHICLAVLLGLLIGHMSIAVHAATHAGGDSGECEFCIAYGHAADTVEPAGAHIIPDGRGERLADAHAPTLEKRHDAPYRPRDPPLSD